MRLNGLVPAAGLSRRMGTFKPLMRIGERTLIEHSVESLYRGGAEVVTVVLGYRADEVEELLRRTLPAQRLRIARNPLYETTDMLASIKEGIVELAPCDAFFLLPGDMPAVGKRTLDALALKLEATGALVVMPTVDGWRKHPPLISSSCSRDILEYGGDGGLRGIWRTYEGRIAEVEVQDVGCLLDIDRMEDFVKLMRYLKGNGLSVFETAANSIR